MKTRASFQDAVTCCRSYEATRHLCLQKAETTRQGRLITSADAFRTAREAPSSRGNPNLPVLPPSALTRFSAPPPTALATTTDARATGQRLPGALPRKPNVAPAKRQDITTRCVERARRPMTTTVHTLLHRRVPAVVWFMVQHLTP